MQKRNNYIAIWPCKQLLLRFTFKIQPPHLPTYLAELLQHQIRRAQTSYAVFRRPPRSPRASLLQQGGFELRLLRCRTYCSSEWPWTLFRTVNLTISRCDSNQSRRICFLLTLTLACRTWLGWHITSARLCNEEIIGFDRRPSWKPREMT